MRRSTLVMALCGAFLVALSGGARAQGTADQALSDRLDRLERDMNMLQRQVYRGSSGTAPVPNSGGGPSALDTQLQTSQIEDQMRQITGQIEEITNDIGQLKQRLDKLSSDVDLRFSALEHGGAALPSAPPPDQPKPPPGGGANPAAPPSRSGTLGTLTAPAATAAPPPAAPPPAQTAAAGAGLPSGTAQEQYNYAFGLLRQANYPAAQQALRSFIQRFPNDPLSGNAQYWLGETYYVSKDYANAATAFAEGYEKYPKGAKAADDLLRLAMSLGNLGQKQDACRAYARLDRDFPTAAANIKDRAATEKQHLGC
jgi:tol-pal system protein YbgF